MTATTLTSDTVTATMQVRIGEHPDGGGDYAVLTDMLVFGAVWTTIVTRECDNLADAEHEYREVVAGALGVGWTLA